MNIQKKVFTALAMATAFTVSSPIVSVQAKDKAQCAQDEKWDKRSKQCVSKNSY